MLTGINPLLTGELLHILDDMGHSDLIIVADANFPAHRLAPSGRVVELPGTDITEVVAAIRHVFPLDPTHPPCLMDSGTSELTDVQADIVEVLGGDRGYTLVDRFDYYDVAATAAAIVSTGERHLWANVGLYKGLPGIDD